MANLLQGVFRHMDDSSVDPDFMHEHVRWHALGEALADDDPDGAEALLNMDDDRLMRSVGRRHGVIASLLDSNLVHDLPARLGVRTGPVRGQVLYELGLDGAFVLHARGAVARLASLAVGLIEGVLTSAGEQADIEVEQLGAESVAIRVTPIPVAARQTTAHFGPPLGR